MSQWPRYIRRRQDVPLQPHASTFAGVAAPSSPHWSQPLRGQSSFERMTCRSPEHRSQVAVDRLLAEILFRRRGRAHGRFTVRGAGIPGHALVAT